MNDKKDHSINYYLNIVKIAFISIALISLAAMLFIYFDKKMYSLPLCISTTCFEKVILLFKPVVSFFVSSIQLVTAIITSIGIYIAVLTYKNTSTTNSLNSHISYFKIFSEYVTLEVNKRSCLDISAFSIFDWYNLIFEKSIEGSILVSHKYTEALSEINNQIEITNSKASKAASGPYRHAEHQNRMIPVFKSIGINIQNYPKNDFMIIEGEILDLIDSINQAFCHKPKKLEKMCVRNYN